MMAERVSRIVSASPISELGGRVLLPAGRGTKRATRGYW